jgi:transcriptional regulator with XRE-family HTH domain
MKSREASEERVDSSERLKSSLVAASVPIKTSEFTRAFNVRANGAIITPHAARKWLCGEAIPTQEKLVILANWLGVHAGWLRFGEPENCKVYDAAIPEAVLATRHLSLILDVISLPESTQKIVREIVDTFLRANQEELTTANRAIG